MLSTIALLITAGTIVALAWYLVFCQVNQRRSVCVLGWIERAFGNNGEVAGVTWVAPSRFHVRLRLGASNFQRASVAVQLMPREVPWSWLESRLRKRQETLTFQADLDLAPGFELEVQSHRWFGRTRRRFPHNSSWSMEHVGPFVLSTRREWQRETSALMNALAASRACESVDVRFRRKSPHFSVTVPVDSLAPSAKTATDFFSVLRELAAGASASRFESS
jgi:hypothetical protein